MMTMPRNLMLAALLAATTFSACKKDNKPSSVTSSYVAKASFTLDGDGYKGQVITISGIKTGPSYGTYFSKGKVTSLLVGAASTAGGALENNISMIFNGKTTSTQHGGDDTDGNSTFSSVYFEATVVGKDNKEHTYRFYDAAVTAQTITITKYGAVGETIEGSFSGTLIDEDGDPNIKISKGTFSITRNPDID